jgi:hypothetical protein
MRRNENIAQHYSAKSIKWVRPPLNEYRAAAQRKSLTCADTITLIQVFAVGLSAKNQPGAVILMKSNNRFGFIIRGAMPNEHHQI